MFYAVVWGYAIVGAGLGLHGENLAQYLSAIVLTIGVSTLLQAWLGHRMAMVSGPNVIPSLAIVAAYGAGGLEYALQAFTAQIIAGLTILVLVLCGLIRYIRKLWSPLVLGSMIMMIGMSVAGLGIASMTRHGMGMGFFISLALALGGGVLAIRGRGVLRTLPPLLIIGFGYAIFFAMGQVNADIGGQTAWFITPRILPYGISAPPWSLIFLMLIVNLMATLNFYGNLQGYAEVIGERVSAHDERRAFILFTLAETILPGLLGVPATVAYGENLGIVQLTRVATRSFVIVAAIIFAGLAFVGPFVELMAAMPDEISGAVLLGIASTVLGIGAHTMAAAPSFEQREQNLVGFSMFLSLGLYLLPDQAWSQVPVMVKAIFSNPVISVILFVMLFERVIFPSRKST